MGIVNSLRTHENTRTMTSWGNDRWRISTTLRRRIQLTAHDYLIQLMIYASTSWIPIGVISWRPQMPWLRWLQRRMQMWCIVLPCWIWVTIQILWVPCPWTVIWLTSWFPPPHPSHPMPSRIPTISIFTTWMYCQVFSSSWVNLRSMTSLW